MPTIWTEREGNGFAINGHDICALVTETKVKALIFAVNYDISTACDIALSLP
ncbi:uncharacterized protein PHALS_05273 [Plasmopara halstedii]|uniref:Uncharacterized protein n=1 Tax=Plasmopara halstedii TaxID=4781 RepID=A0A0P1B268_PLAHL|nr:uncharacterized protein PHALS_05273 [Plasmopara halstedii]CEG47950.1 hypothetical protein PHALS_05273 [Plasmopara halstedii]|eukprot:XP_024584319.1 hypothetical protein PHALS_05273 [Plasmopara halstedii]